MTRDQYMNAASGADRSTAAALHRQYYAQLVNSYTIACVVNLIGADVLLASTKPHFNDIPLQRWHRVGPIAPTAMSFTALGDYATEAGLVCVAKEAARQWVEAQSTEITGAKE